MRLINFWILKKKEKLIIKVVQWAQRNKKKVESLTKKEIAFAIKE